MSRTTDWSSWHTPYDDPSSPLARRLAIVQRLVSEALNGTPPGPIRVISVCAGEGRDLLGVLAVHPRAGDVDARLVELDPRNAEVARAAALAGVDVVVADASHTSIYEGAVPADLLLVCGVFGNIPDADVERTISYLPTLCAPGAAVIWTRHRKPPDLTIAIRRWFVESGFEETAFESQDFWGVGANRFVGAPRPFEPKVRLFTFFR